MKTKKRTWNTKEIPQEAFKKTAQKIKEPYKGGAFKPYIVPEWPAFVPHDGENKIRFVRPLEFEELNYYGLEVHFHREVGPNKDYFLCMNRMAKKKCYICEQQTSDLWDMNRDLAKSLYPDVRFLFWILDLNSDEPEKLLLWSCPKTLAENIMAQSHRKSSDTYIDISHPTTGIPIFFDRAGKGLQTKYTGIQLDDKPTTLPDEILEDMVELSDVLIVPTYEEIKASYEGTEIPDNDEVGSQEDENSIGEDIPYHCNNCHNIEDECTCNISGVSENENTESIPDGCQDCFRENFDEFKECDECQVRELCSMPPLPVVKEKPSKPTRTKKAEPEAEKEQLPRPSKEEQRKKLQEAIARKKK